MSGIVKEKVKLFYFYGFGFRYVKGITDENDIIKGGNLYAFGKQLLTVAVSNTEWVDEQGMPYKFKLDGRILFVKKLAIGFL